MTLIKYLFSSIIFLISCSESKNNSQQLIIPDSKKEFIKWAKQNYVPIHSFDSIKISALGKHIGNKKIVAISEGFHNCKENLIINKQLIKYLVEKKGFNTVVLESPLPESSILYNYTLGKPVNEDILWKHGVNILYNQWEEGRKLINWIRDYNKVNNNKLFVYGIDIGGGGYTNWYYPMQLIFDYLHQVDNSNELHVLLDKINLYVKQLKSRAAYVYFNVFNIEERYELNILLKKLVEQFKSNKNAYIKKSSTSEYEWIKQSAKSMLFASYYFLNYQDRVGSKEQYTGLNGREVAMSSNFEWVFNLDNTKKVIIVSHVIHNKTETQQQLLDMYGQFTPSLELIKQKHESDVFAIGFCYGNGFFWDKWVNKDTRVIKKIPKPKENGIENVLSKISSQYYISLNKNSLQKKCLPWLNSISNLRENDYFIRIKPSEWDAVLYIDSVSPATPIKKPNN